MRKHFQDEKSIGKRTWKTGFSTVLAPTLAAAEMIKVPAAPIVFPLIVVKSDPVNKYYGE